MAHKKILILIITPFLLFSHSHDKWIIVTTIQYPTEALKKLSQLPDWQLLVIGDKKTPLDWYLDEKCIYLSPESQEKLPYTLAKLLPWNHYSRKNIGYLYAIDHGAKIIYETDDDNYIKNDIKIFSDNNDIKTLVSDSSVINVYAYFGQKNLWPRGFPLAMITKHDDYKVLTDENHKKIVIEQGLVDGDPDVDAILRLTRTDSTNIFFDNDQPACILSKKSFCPFNTQNTLFHKEAFWGLYIPSNVPFRVCDIWRGYITQRLLQETEMCLCFTPATAIQERNVHDFMKDFVGELDIYTKMDSLITLLSTWKSKDFDVLENMKNIYIELMLHKFIGDKEKILIDAWINDLNNIQKD